MSDTMKRRCGACGVEEGRLHMPGCDMEPCADCGGQRISCDCNAARRLPFIAYPTYCARCGAEGPAMFMVPNEVWAYYIEPKKRGAVICRLCFEEIQHAVDDHQGPPPFGDFEIQTDRQLWAAANARLIKQAEEAGYPDIAADLRAQAEAMDAKLARREAEEMERRLRR